MEMGENAEDMGVDLEQSIIQMTPERSYIILEIREDMLSTGVCSGKDAPPHLRALTLGLVEYMDAHMPDIMTYIEKSILEKATSNVTVH